MTFSESVRTVLREKYATFSGRAPRSEYWWFALFTMIVGFVLGILFMAVGGAAWYMSLVGIGATGVGEFAPLGVLPKLVMIIYLLWSLFVIVPSIAVMVRRFHDRNLSGWWILGLYVACIIPFVGIIAMIALIVLLCLKGTAGENKFGADPLA